MMYIKETKQQLISRCKKLHKLNESLKGENLSLSTDNGKLKVNLIKSENDYDDIIKVKESIQLQNQTLEKRLLATEVELLRKIVSLYEKQPVQQPIIYNYPNSNGVTTTGTTTTTASNTIYGY